MVAKAELRSKDKEAREGSVSGVDKPREEASSLFVDRKYLKLKDDLNCAMKDGEDEEDDCNSGCGDPVPLRKKVSEGVDTPSDLPLSPRSSTELPASGGGRVTQQRGKENARQASGWEIER